MDWDEYFMTLVYLIAMRSKDQSTHLGAVIVGLDQEIRSSGYNSFPRGINDYVKERQERPEKYYWFEHAERNAIYNSARVGIPLKDCIMYTQGIPCADCARAIIQSGIKEVVIHKDWEEESNSIEKSGEKLNRGVVDWSKDRIKRTSKMFEEAGVKIRFFEGKLNNKLNSLFRGVELKNIWKEDEKDLGES